MSSTNLVPGSQQNYKLDFGTWSYLLSFKSLGVGVFSNVIAFQNDFIDADDCGFNKTLAMTLGITAVVLGIFDLCCCTNHEYLLYKKAPDDNPFRCFYKVRTGISLTCGTAAIALGIIGTVGAALKNC